MIDFPRSLRLWHLHGQCREQEERAQRATLGWLHQCHRLTSLKECARTSFFAQQSLDLNELFLNDVKNKLLRKCVKEVVRVQRALVRFEKETEAAVEKEKKFDAEWRSEMRKHREGN
ncbi:hypothetical protein P3342_006782 [Pyrenophora teres f. teres]|uniref:Uncharacterized protein n=2 Tax=Pyrenophora teres f. teres TaxID=97479 RepID=E3RLJ5_PYRTT|nr:hypothetical protein PTT_09243 [Pyrenophora teres f. teres 0-1]KAK1908902.1 hypothetical protein P3342_006782 [Pyrenophora teres f. teres]